MDFHWFVVIAPVGSVVFDGFQSDPAPPIRALRSLTARPSIHSGLMTDYAFGFGSYAPVMAGPTM